MRRPQPRAGAAAVTAEAAEVERRRLEAGRAHVEKELADAEHRMATAVADAREEAIAEVWERAHASAKQAAKEEVDARVAALEAEERVREATTAAMGPAASRTLPGPYAAGAAGEGAGDDGFGGRRDDAYACRSAARMTHSTCSRAEGPPARS